MPPALPSVLRRLRVGCTALAMLLAANACSDHDPAAPRDPGTPGPTSPAPTSPVPPVVTHPGTPTSHDLIEAAVRAGSLSPDQAVIERVWAATGDARLDARFRDPHAATRQDAPDRLGEALRDAGQRLPTLSAAVQRELVPYFQPPAYVGSAWTRRRTTAATAATARVAARATAPGAPSASVARLGGPDIPGPVPIPAEGWSYVDIPGVPVRVWSHPEFSKRTVDSFWDVTVEGIAAELPKSWAAFTALMGRPPVPDGGLHAFNLIDGTPTAWGDGGSPALDIYLVSPSDLGVYNTGGALTMAYPPGCSARPSFMLVSPEFNKDHKLGPLLAHELFHAFQFAFDRMVPCTDMWDESTAQWASRYAYPRWESADRMDMLLQLEEQQIGGPTGYTEFLFNSYLQFAHTPQLVRATYEAYVTTHSAMDALNLALPGGLKRHMKEFAVHAYNQAPAGRSFFTWEGAETTPQVNAAPPAVELAAGERRHEWAVDAPREQRTRVYRRYGVARGGTTDGGAQGDTVRWLEFTNPHAGAAKASVQAFVKLRGGDWKLQDWSDRRTVSFCYKNAGERVDSLVIIMSDHRLPESGDKQPLPKGKLEARDACPKEPREYVIQARYWTTSEQYGTEYDVSYAARVWETEPGSGSLKGSGSYRGTILRLYPANCNVVPGEWPKDAVTVSGGLDATAFTVTQAGGREAFGYSLVTKDWTWMPIYERHARTDDEREAAAGSGTVTTGVNLLTLVGGSVDETSVRGTSTSVMKCAGLVTHHRQVTVTRMR